MKKILFIEDEEDLITVIKMRLEAGGFDFVCALDGEEGLKKVYEEKPDLILLDLIMPKMDGIEVCRRLKADPETSGIPIIIITAAGDKNLEDKGKCAGAECVMTKPYESSELLARINSLI